MIGRWMKKPVRSERLLRAARYFMDNPTALDTVDGVAEAPEVSGSVAALAGIVTQLDGASPVPTTQGTLRCAARFTGQPVDRMNKRSHGRMAIGRLVGAGEDRNAATVALLELASDLCTPQAPRCGTCPLRRWCAHATGS
jgi:DNA (cytosine-5)-methyltransferase 1